MSAIGRARRTPNPLAEVATSGDLSAKLLSRAEKAARLEQQLFDKSPASVLSRFPRVLERSTASEAELARLASNQHTDPHSLLGSHSIEWNGQTATVLRALFPDRESANAVVIAPRGSTGSGERFLRVPMTRVHNDGGIFEAILPRQPQGTRHHFEVTEADGFVAKSEDPYRFPPSISELHLWLFNEGKLDDAGKLLGARQKKIDGKTGFSFSVWAPNATRVSVVGDFNDWDGRRHPMRQLGNSGVFELFIPDVAEGQRYQFEMRAPNGRVFRKSDPCATRTELRPGVSSVTLGPSKHQWNDGEWMANRARFNALERPVSIYELHLGSWMRGQKGEFLDYRRAADKIVPYLQDHGFTHVELIGLAEHPLDDSWGYQVTGYYAPTSRHGAPDDFKYFVDKCHQAGIGVLYDWVPAHFPSDGHALSGFDGTHLFDHEDARQGAHKDWGTRIFNYGRHEVRSFLIGGLVHMLDEYHLDGSRVDAVASMLYRNYSRKDGEWVPNIHGGVENLEAIDFLRQANSRVGARFPGVMRIAEESTAFPGVTKAAKDEGLGFDLKWNMGWMNDTLRWFETPHEARGEKLDMLTNTFLWAHSEKYICALSHDEIVHGKNSLLNKMPGDDWQKFANLRLLYGYMWSYPGHKLLMMGSEFGQRGEWNFKKGLEWKSLEGDNHRGVARLIGDLNRLYRDEPALYEKQFDADGMEMVSRDEKNAVVAIRRRARDAANDILFVHNTTQHPRNEYRIGVEKPGRYAEVLNTDAAIYGGSNTGNLGGVVAEKVPAHGKPYSIAVTLPPLATIAFKREGDAAKGKSPPAQADARSENQAAERKSPRGRDGGRAAGEAGAAARQPGGSDG